MTEDQLISILALQHVPKIGATTAKKLITHCGSAEAVFKEKTENSTKTVVCCFNRRGEINI